MTTYQAPALDASSDRGARIKTEVTSKKGAKNVTKDGCKSAAHQRRPQHEHDWSVIQEHLPSILVGDSRVLVFFEVKSPPEEA